MVDTNGSRSLLVFVLFILWPKSEGGEGGKEEGREGGEGGEGGKEEGREGGEEGKR